MVSGFFRLLSPRGFRVFQTVVSPWFQGFLDCCLPVVSGFFRLLSPRGFRVVQKNLVFVVGLSQRLAEPEVLRKHEYFGKFGKIHKVVINQSTSYAGAQVSKVCEQAGDGQLLFLLWHGLFTRRKVKITITLLTF